MPDRLAVVLDTNGLLAAIPSRSPYRIILDALFDGVYDAFVSTDVLLEYNEKIAEFFDPIVAEDIIGGLLLLPNVRKTDIYFNLTLIDVDKDDRSAGPQQICRLCFLGQCAIHCHKRSPFQRFKAVRFSEAESASY